MSDGFGTLLVSLGIVTEAQLAEAVAHQRFTGNRVAETLLALGYVTRGDLKHVMSEIRKTEGAERKLGEVLVELDFVTPQTLEQTLAAQLKDRRPLGELLVEQGACTYQQVFEALGEQRRAPTRPRSRIVVIDDSQIACTIVAEGLRDLGYTVAEFNDPVEALAAIDEFKPDIVVTDLQMPGMDGVQVARRLASDGRGTRIPVIILTANESESAAAGLQAGADDYVKKGTAIEELGARIDGIVRRTSATTRIRKLFAQYTSDAVVDQLLSAGDVVLTGEKREVSVVFADIRNFTSLAETLEPEQVMSLLNDALGRMADAVLGCGGTIDKFLGDGLMAVFGAPIKRDDDARWALAAARGMLRVIAERNATATLPLAIGIGINTGLAVCGSLGNERRTEYTVIGDTVNVASRLCALANENEILVGEGTVKRVGDSASFIALEPVKLKGKAQPVPVFRVAD